MHETWFTDIDWNCPRYNKPEYVSRKNFLEHLKTKSTDRLREIVIAYNMVEFPHALKRYALINIVLDYCKEPLASEIIKKYPVVR